RYNINSSGNSVTVAFAPKTAAKGGAVKSTPSEPPSHLTTTNTEVQSTAPVETAAATLAGIPAPAAVLPAALTQTTAMLARPTAEAESKATAPEPAATAPPPAAQKETPHPLVNGQSPAPAPSGKYSGEPISVNLKDVDLRDFFRLIHEIS